MVEKSYQPSHWLIGNRYYVKRMVGSGSRVKSVAELFFNMGAQLYKKSWHQNLLEPFRCITICNVDGYMKYVPVVNNFLATVAFALV